jgi:peptidyl-prolyl isomerase F (cyclophilin D)
MAGRFGLDGNQLFQPIEQQPRSSRSRKKGTTWNPRVYFCVEANGESLGRIVIELFTEIVPKTAENFRRALHRGKRLWLQGSMFHRIIPQFMIQGGDFTNHNGTGGRRSMEPVRGRKFSAQTHRAGNRLHGQRRPNTNGSQFFITTVKTAWLDGKHVVFRQSDRGHGGGNSGGALVIQRQAAADRADQRVRSDGTQS